MQKETIIMTDNNVTPVASICVVSIDTTVQPPVDTTTTVDYNSLTASEKTQFDNFVAMIKTKA